MVKKKPRVLIVDDDHSLCEIIANVLSDEDYETGIANDGKTALSKLKKDSFDLMLLDLKLLDMSGMKILKKAIEIKPSIQVVMISGQGTISTAVEATRIGAFDFLEKPLDSERVLVSLRNAFEKGQLKKEKAHLLESVKEHYTMVGDSPAMKKVHELITKAAVSNSKVLIEGENGTGKELVARAIYINSQRVDGPFITVNCAAIPDSLIESELFGHKKGAFTGAVEDKSGRFQMADGGTLFLDEVGDMSIMTQAKVLRVLEEGKVEIVGGSKPIQTDVRVIAATNKYLQDEMKEGKFRKDLYFRLNVLNIKVPPLRERKEDIPLLIEYFVKHFCDEHGIIRKQISLRAMSQLVGYSWPGNVRELKNFVEKLIFLIEKTKILPKDVSSIFKSYTKSKSVSLASLTLKEARREFERTFIEERLMACKGNVSKTAKILSIPRTYLHRKMKNLEMVN